jgi:hypothetical protein
LCQVSLHSCVSVCSRASEACAMAHLCVCVLCNVFNVFNTPATHPMPTMCNVFNVFNTPAMTMITPCQCTSARHGLIVTRGHPAPAQGPGPGPHGMGGRGSAGGGIVMLGGPARGPNMPGFLTGGGKAGAGRGTPGPGGTGVGSGTGVTEPGTNLIATGNYSVEDGTQETFREKVKRIKQKSPRGTTSLLTAHDIGLLCGDQP